MHLLPLASVANAREIVLVSKQRIPIALVLYAVVDIAECELIALSDVLAANNELLVISEQRDAIRLTRMIH